ncbi:hypothetical protein ACOSQ4_002241 [Xanthoceras sorbifolium]
MGAVKTNRVIIRMSDGNVMGDTNSNVAYKADYWDNAGIEERVGVKKSLADLGSGFCSDLYKTYSKHNEVVHDMGTQKQRKGKRRAREKRDANHEIDGDAVLKKRFLKDEEGDCGLRK